MENMEKLIYNGWLKIYHLTKKINGSFVNLEFLKKRPASAALVYNTEKNKFIFVKQFRAGVGSDIIEIPAGVQDLGDTPESAIRREILEETGYLSDKVQLISSGFVSPGYTSEKISIYYVEVSKKVSNGGGLLDEHEEIEIVEMSLEDFMEYNFIDMKTNLSKLWLISNMLS